MTVRVKICGVTTASDARAVVRAGADAVGVNLWPGSKRHVPAGRAGEVFDAVTAPVWKVGVFVDEDPDVVRRRVVELGLDMVQLHGDEPPEACRGMPVPVIKALPVRDRASLEEAIGRYGESYLLLDAAVPGARGGTGRTFDWDLAALVDPGRLFLAGGLDPDNVADAVRRVRPFAVDVASGVESSVGVKDPDRVREFVCHAKDA